MSTGLGSSCARFISTRPGEATQRWATPAWLQSSHSLPETVLGVNPLGLPCSLSHGVALCTQGGILSIDAAPGNEGLVATAGADGVVVLFDRAAGRIKASLTGHSKKVNGGFLHLCLGAPAGCSTPRSTPKCSLLGPRLCEIRHHTLML